MRNRTCRKRISYWVDCMMSRGTVAMSVLLFAITAAIVGAIGVVASFVSSEGSMLYQLWSSLMYTLDAGNLAGVPTDNIVYLLLMFLATLCGLFLTSVLIGIIATGVENKLSNLRKGTSVVLEEHHTVIIGFDSNAFAIVRELIEANANQKHACIVIVGEQPKEEMEEAIASHIPDTQTTRIICRSGKMYETYVLERCSIETCHSVIVNTRDDTETVKIMLALAAYTRDKALTNPNLQFVASLQDKEYVEAAKIAGEGRATVVFAKDAIARIIANTCRQHGLSQVLTELFSFGGNEFYFEHIPQLEGKTFHEATLSFSNAVAVGLVDQDRVQLNPPMNTVIGQNSRVILVEVDDGAYAYHPASAVDAFCIRDHGNALAKASDHLLVLGSNDKLPTILGEYAKYVQKGTRVVLVDDELGAIQPDTYGPLEITVQSDTITRDLLCRFLRDGFNNILLLCDESQDSEASDTQTLLRLILVRDIADTNHFPLAITTEMHSVDHQRLATQARVDDYVIGSSITGCMLALISENPEMAPLIDELLDESGSELYMKPAVDYVATGVPVDSYMLTESAARKGEVYVGYRLIGGANTSVVVNPRKDELITFGAYDQVVVIAEE